MPFDIYESARVFIREHRVARLATVDSERRPMVIPICYAFDGECLYTPIDEKPKSVAAGALKRVRNVISNSQVAVVIDEYVEDWTKLAYVLVSGEAEILEPGSGNPEYARAVELLREKYAQYRSMAIDQRPLIRIRPLRVKMWTGS